MQFNLLTVRGKVNTAGMEARLMHNQTAGSPEGVFVAKQLGDLSHITYLPPDASTWTHPQGERIEW